MIYEMGLMYMLVWSFVVVRMAMLLSQKGFNINDRRLKVKVKVADRKVTSIFLTKDNCAQLLCTHVKDKFIFHLLIPPTLL